MENALSAHDTRVSAARAARGGKCCSMSFSFVNMKTRRKEPNLGRNKEAAAEIPQDRAFLGVNTKS